MTPLKEYCEWLEDLTSRGDTISAKGLEKYIREYANEYHKSKSQNNNNLQK
jgi:hypothetical protein